MTGETLTSILENVKDLNFKLEKIKEEIRRYSAEQDNVPFSLDRQFSLINLPSKGEFYPNKKKTLLVRYLTAIEENILVDQMVMESGKGLEFILDNIIIDKDIKACDLLLSDYQAVLMFLRSTAYGDNIDLKCECPSCKKENDFKIYISKLNFKERKTTPEDAEGYLLKLPKSMMNVRIKPLTFKEEFETSKRFEGEKFSVSEDGVFKEYKRESTIKLLTYIRDINGVTDKDIIRKVLKKLPKLDSDFLNEFIKENESGIENNLDFECSFCSYSSTQYIDLGFNILLLPASYTSNLWEELFLITYYGKNVTMQDAMTMPVVRRKWHLNRIRDEVDKKNEAERSAAIKAKSASNSKSRR